MFCMASNSPINKSYAEARKSSYLMKTTSDLSFAQMHMISIAEIKVLIECTELHHDIVINCVQKYYVTTKCPECPEVLCSYQ
jgi:hypothetical protein